MKCRRTPLKSGTALSRFANDSSGAVAIMAALAFPVLVGGMALGAEASFWYLSQRKLQQAADFAAYAAAVQLRSGRTESEMWAAARDMAAVSGLQPGDDMFPEWPPKTGVREDDWNAVEIILSRQQIRYFTLIYDSDPVSISARAVAEVRGGGDACLLSLDPTASKAITVTGSAEVTFNGCDVATNSNASDAFHMQGGAVRMTSGCVHSVGGANITDGLSLTTCTSPNIEAPVTADPYADLDPPEVPESCPKGSVIQRDDATVYCGGWSVKNDTHFEPGVHIISGGSFEINGNINVSGAGVTFYLTNGATLDLRGNATIDLSAPTSGTYTGVLFFGDRQDIGVTHKINGNAGSRVNGAVYFPTADLDYSGNFSGTNSCTQIVSRRIEFTGNSNLSVNCSATGTRRIAVAETIALVE